jgi:hypothetical protein
MLRKKITRTDAYTCARVRARHQCLFVLCWAWAFHLLLLWVVVLKGREICKGGCKEEGLMKKASQELMIVASCKKPCALSF